MTYRVELGTDVRENLTRMDNPWKEIPKRIKAVKAQLENLQNQQENAKAEVEKPFPQEMEFQEKNARLAELDFLLNMDENEPTEKTECDEYTEFT